MSAGSPTIRVTAHDLDTDQADCVDLKPGQFVVTCANPLYVADETRNEQGDIVLTLKRKPVTR